MRSLALQCSSYWLATGRMDSCKCQLCDYEDIQSVEKNCLVLCDKEQSHSV